MSPGHLPTRGSAPVRPPETFTFPRGAPPPVRPAKPSSPRFFRRQVSEGRGEVPFLRASQSDRLNQRVQHLMPVLAQVEEALRGLPQLGRVATPQPVRKRNMPVDVLGASLPTVSIAMIGVQQGAPVSRLCRVQRGQVDTAVTT